MGTRRSSKDRVKTPTLRLRWTATATEAEAVPASVAEVRRRS